MTLPPSSTAPKAIRALADLIRQGLGIYRSVRAQECRAHYTVELKRRYNEEALQEFPVIGSGPLLLKPSQVLKCQFSKAEQPDLPPTWGAVVYEEYNWPRPDVDADEPRQPFRLFLQVQRGPYKFRLPIHDEREQWVGPKFKARMRFLRFPMSPGFHLGTFFVYRDGLRTTSMCQWLTIIFAQRGFLTKDEENATIEAFFTPGSKRGLPARLGTYERLKRTFVQPTGGWISFPALYQATLRQLMRDEPRQIAGGSSAKDDEEGPVLNSWDAQAAKKHIKKVHRDMPLDHPASYMSLRQLRREEPALHRALLDRIRQGRVKTQKINGEAYVSTLEADRADEERRRNAAFRTARRFPGMRTEWARQLSTRGIKYKSAQRQIKRWINVLKLSEPEIQASVARGRLVRLQPERK